jgi:hypothetical protein
VRWETNVKNGVCGVQFDRRDIQMNKFVATCLEAQFNVFEARTQHPKQVGAAGGAVLQDGGVLVLMPLSCCT